MYFSASNIQDLKKQYKALVKKFHPDNGGDEEILKSVNQEYEKALKELTEPKERDNINWDDVHAYMDKLTGIINVPGVFIEIIGTWLWVSGDTTPVKDQLKENGFKWHSKKKMWFWYPGKYRRFGKRQYSIDEIRNKYGSDLISKKPIGIERA